MAAQKGRNMLLKISDGGGTPVYTTIAGIRSRSLTINNDTVDITTSDDAPWQQLFADTGARSVAVSASGVFLDDTAGINPVEDLAFNGNFQVFQLVFENGDIIQGTFQVTSFAYSGEHLAEQTFDISLTSSGTVTMTRA